MSKKKKKAKQPPPPPKRRKIIAPIAVVLLLISAVSAMIALNDGSDAKNRGGVVEYTYRVVNQFPHDPKAYTQGLMVHNGLMYESTGLYKESSVRKVDIESGQVLAINELDDDLFGEGLCFFRGVLFQITWQAGRALVYDSDELRLLREYEYEGEGWGLTTDGEVLFMSDGSDTLTVRDPSDFSMIRTLPVTGAKVGELNELEYIDGEIWANAYRDFRVWRISPETGAVLGVVDFRGILKRQDRRGGEDVFNGIAHDPATGRLYVTGKRYSFMYEVEVIERSQ